MVDVVSWALELERSTPPGTSSTDIRTRNCSGPSPPRRQRGRRRHPVLGADDPGAEGGTHPVPHRDAANAPPHEGVRVFDPAAFVAILRHPGVDHRRPGADQRRPADHHAARRGHRRRQTARRPVPHRPARPAVAVVGDEIANVAPLPKLPGLLSDSRGIGIQWFAAFQSVAQIIARWGEDDGRQILANLNCSLILGGLQDERPSTGSPPSSATPTRTETVRTRHPGQGSAVLLITLATPTLGRWFRTV